MARKYEIRVGEALKDAWQIFLKGPEVFIGLAFVWLLVNFLLSYLPVAGQLATLLIYSIMPASIYMAAASATGKETVSFRAAAEEIVPFVPQLLTLGVIKGILISVGLLLLVLPGIYLVVVLFYAELFVLLRRQSFWEAMKSSHELARANLLGSFGLCLFMVLLAWSGVLLVGIGLLLSMPMAFLTLFCVFRRISFQQDPVVVPAESTS